MDFKSKFQQAKYECDQHIHHLEHALGGSNHLFPLDESKIKGLRDEEIAFLDQLIFRFTRLQDTMGNKLFSVGLSSLGEPVEEMTMLDKLHRLEKLSIISNAQKWLSLRELRNEFNHEYPDQDQIKAESLNLLRASITYLKSTPEIR